MPRWNSRPVDGTPTPWGTLHGGILCEIADAAMAWHTPQLWATEKPSRRWNSRSSNPQPITHTPQITNNATVNCRPTLADIMRASEGDFLQLKRAHCTQNDGLVRRCLQELQVFAHTLCFVI